MPSFPIQLKRNGTAAATPSSLLHGEVALNYADGKLFWKDASNVIQSFTFQAYALSSHSHGNITNAGAIGSTANLPIITTTSGVLTTGSFGTTAATFCEGNDSRLSDTRTPTDGSVTTAKIANDAVTYAKLQNVSATDRLLGRSSAGSGDVEEITCTSFGRSLIDDADAAAARTTLSVQPTASPAFTGAATFAGSVQLNITNAPLDSAGNLRVFTTDTQAADKGGQIGLGGQNGSAGSFDPWSFAVIKGAKENSTSGNLAGYVVFATANSGGVLGERLRISSTGTATFAGQIVGQAGAAISGGTVTVTSPLVLTGTVAGNVRQLRMQTSGSTRWEVGPGFDAESGSNVGSTFWITRWSDSGVFLGTPIAIARATGVVTFESQVLVTAGSGSSGSYKPGLAISGDDDTGVMQTTAGGANTLSLVTNSTERVRVDAIGNVGIGIAPSTQLHVGSLGVFRLQTGSVTMDCTPTAGALDGFVWNTNPASYYQWNTGGTQRLLIGSDGKVTCKGLYDNTVGATNRDVFVDSGGVVGYVSSIRESKTDIVTLDDVSWLSSLSPVSYRYRKRNADGTYSDEADGVTDYGLIAEDVETVRPELCFYDDVDGEPQLRGVTYSKLITPMLRYIQQLEQRIAALEERLNHA